MNQHSAYIDKQKALDLYSRDMVLYKLYEYFLWLETFTILSHPYIVHLAPVLRWRQISYFDFSLAVKQSDTLCPRLFALHVNDQAVEARSLNCGWCWWLRCKYNAVFWRQFDDGTQNN